MSRCGILLHRLVHDIGVTVSLLAVRIVCPFLDNLLGGLATAVVVPSLRRSTVLLRLFLIVNILDFFRGTFKFFRRIWPGSRLLVAPMSIPVPAMMTGVVPPVVPPLPKAGLALQGLWLLLCLLWRHLRWLLPGILWLRVFFCHNCQTD
jgi:hypothetical protein